MTFLVTWIHVLQSAFAACESPTTNEDLVVVLEKAADAYGALDRDTFEASLRDAKAIVPCLGQVISRPAAAELHRATALSAFLARDQDLARQRFAAARSIEPSYAFPDTLVPEGNPVRDLYTALDPKSSPILVLPTPEEGSLRLDGSVTAERATLFPVVFQRLDGDGAVVESVLLSPGAPPPTYAVGKGRADSKNGVAAKKSPMVPLLVVAGTLAAGAIAVNVGANLSKKGYVNHMEMGGSDAEFIKAANQKRGTTNALTLTAGGLGLAAVGTGAVAVITGVF